MAKKKATKGKKKKTIKKKKSSISIGKVYTKKSKLKYKKRLTKKENKEYTKREKKAKREVSKYNRKLKAYAKKLKKGGLTKSEKKKLAKKKTELKKKAKSTKAVKSLNTYKKKLDRKYNKKPKSGASKATQKTQKAIKRGAKERTQIKSTMKSKARNRAYMINNKTNQILVFQFNPEKVPYDRKVSYNSIESPGQAYPKTQFSKGEALEFTVDLFMYTPTKQGKVNTVNSRGVYSGKKPSNWKSESETGWVAIDDRINNARKFLLRLMPPYQNSKSFGIPPTCTFAFGYFVWNNCVVTGLKVEDERLDSRGRPIQTKFSVTLRKV